MTNILAQSNDNQELPRNVIFKISPKIDENTPDWAKMMYADFPNIHKVEKAYNEYYKAHTFVKNNNTQNYKQWKREVIHHVNDNGDFVAKDKSEENKAFRKLYEARRKRLKKKSSSSSWNLLGPNYTVSPNETTSTPGESQGNVKCLTISKSDPLIMYAGTESGGIYRTIDGGDSWALFSSDMPLRRIDDIVISPRDNDVVYALGYTGSGLNEYALYILNDGTGQDWVELWSLSNQGNDGKIVLTDDELFREEFMIGIGRGPIGGLYHLTRNQIFQLEANQIFDEPVWDVTLKRDNDNVVYVLKSDESKKLVEFHKSTNGGTTFSKITNGWYASDNTDEDNKAFGAQFAQTDANSTVLYALVSAELKASDDGYLGIFKSSNSGDSWTLMNDHLGAPYSASHHNLVGINFMGSNILFQSPYNLALAVSDNDENKLAVGGLDLSRSDDGGVSFTRVAGYNAQLLTTNFHVDVQELHFQNDDLWVTNDGGIAKTENLFSSVPIFLNKTFGLHATEFWGFGQGWNKDVVFGGTYHNGDKVYNKDAYANGAFKLINNGNAEEPSGSVHPIKDLLHGQHNGPNKSGIKRTRLPASETSKPVNLNEIILKNEVDETTFAQSPEIEYDFQNFDHWYLGSKQHLVYVKDEGASFDTIHSFSAGKILQIKIDRTNPLVFYVTVRTVENNQSIIRFYKSTDRGNTFVQKGQDYLAFGATMDINHHLGYIYLALFSGSDPAKNKIYRSFTRGEDWSEANLGILEGLRLHYIVSAQDDDRELCYIGTNLGVYKLENLVVSDMSLGLPIAASIRKLAIFHRDSKLRAATTGYGVYEIEIPESTPLITPTVNNMGASSCLATFQFDSYSIINQEGVTWEWTFSRTPAEIDDYNIRNPVVSFYAGNPVTATLNVTKNGTTYSKTIENIPISCEKVIETVQHARAQNDGCFQLTTNSAKRYGAVWGTQKLDLSKAFSLSCTLDLGDLPGNSGGGISFVLQRQGIDANGTPKEAGNQGISPSLAVIFRTWIIDQIFVVPDGQDNSADLINNNPSISGSGPQDVTFTWDPKTKTLEVDWNNDGIDVTLNEDIVANYFSGDPTNIIWGFTGQTGDATPQQVCNINLLIGECPTNYAGTQKLEGVIDNDGLFDSDGAIESAQSIVNNAQIEYSSLTSLELLEEFNIETGVQMEMFMDGCISEIIGQGYCVDPYILQLDRSFRGDTFNGAAVMNEHGNLSVYTAPEKVHAILIDPGTTIKVVMSDLNSDLDLYHYLACDEDRISGSTNSSTSNEELLITNASNAPQLHFIIVDGYFGATSTYKLAITEL